LEPLQFQPCTQAHNNAECIGEMCPLWVEA
jgi:hypothetical protein